MATRHVDHIATETLATDFQVTTEALDSETHEVISGVTAQVAKN